MNILIALAIGLVGGTLSGLLGIGGGVILIPGMVLLLGVEQHLAQGVSLATIAVTASVGALVHHRQGNVRLDIALWMVPTAIIFSVLGAWLAAGLNPLWLRRGFALLLLVMGGEMALKGLGRGR